MRDELFEIDAVIERALRGQATRAEIDRLTVWRRTNSANERRFRHAEQLIATARELTSATAAAPPRPTAATILARAEERRRRSGLGARLARLAPWSVAAAAVLIALLGGRQRAAPPDGQPAEIVTGAGELATVKLADGTVVRLAPSSRLLLGSAADGREVTLDGRAFFAVTTRPDQPFLVHTTAATAKVLGTRFELVAEADALQLMVLEGKVALAARLNSVEVVAGQGSGVRDGTATAPARLDDVARSTAWLGRFLVFQRTPLGEAARDIERVYGVRVAIADAALAATTITANFTDRDLDNVIEVVCAVVGATCATRDDVVSIGR